MRNLFPRLLLLAVMCCNSLCLTSSFAAKLELEAKQEKPKMMKGRTWNLLKYDNGDVIAYENTSSAFSLVRFDKTFTVKQENSVKKAPQNLAYIYVGESRIDAVLYDKNNIQHLTFDRNTLQVLKTDILLEQQKYKGSAAKYSHVFVQTSPNGKYIAVFAMWEHSGSMAFSSNQLLLYNDQFEKVGGWSIDEDMRHLTLDSKASYALWQYYYPTFKLCDDGTVVYAALSDYASNLYSSEFGSGSFLKVHVLTKDGDKEHDFGMVAAKKHLQNPCILSYDGSKLLLSTDVFSYPPAKVNNYKEFVYRIDGYCMLECDLTENKVASETGTYEDTYTGIVESGAWNLSYTNVGGSAPYGIVSPLAFEDKGYLRTYDQNRLGLVMMDTKGQNRKTFTLGYAYTQTNKGMIGGAVTSHMHDLQMQQAVYTESNTTLCTAVKGNLYYWVVLGAIADGSWSKEKYQTTLSVNVYDISNRTAVSDVVFQQKSREAMSVQALPVSEGKYLILIDNCQWGTLEL